MLCSGIGHRVHHGDVVGVDLYFLEHEMSKEQHKDARPYRLLKDDGSKYFGESWDLAEQPAQQALDKMAENARDLGLDYELPITMQEGEFDCTHAERLCAELKAAHPVTPCTHPSLGFCSLRKDGTAYRWNCVMCGTEFVPKATNRWAEFNEATKRNMKHAEWYLSTHPQPAQPAIPDPIHHTDLGETLEYIQGWNDCRAEMLRGRPAQRTWVGLTDEEKSDIWCVVTNRDFVTEDTHVYADAIEAKLRSKNEDRN